MNGVEFATLCLTRTKGGTPWNLYTSCIGATREKPTNFIVQVVIMRHLGQIKNGYARVLHCYSFIFTTYLSSSHYVISSFHTSITHFPHYFPLPIHHSFPTRLALTFPCIGSLMCMATILHIHITHPSKLSLLSPTLICSRHFPLA